MTIYAIRSARFGDLWDVTNHKPSTDWINADVVIEEHPDADVFEMAEVAALNEWLHANYHAGAHWIVETMDDCRHVLELRTMTPGEYRVALERHWRGMEDYSADIKGA